MPSLSELPGELSRDKLIRALRHLGFEIDTRGGKGSHYKVTYISNQKSITIPDKLNKQRLKYVLNEMYSVTGVDWEDIKKKI